MAGNSSIIKNFKGLTDSTLREGAQSALFNLTLDEQIQVIKSLGKDGFNIDLLELNIPSSEQTRKEIKILSQIPNRPPIIVLIRNRLDDLKYALDCNLEGICVLCTIDENRLKQMGMTFEQHLQELSLVIQQAKAHNVMTKVVVEDYFRLNKQQALKIYQQAVQWGVDRIAVPDTTGAATPWEVEYEIKKIRKAVGEKMTIDVHFHNNVGNVLSALRAGANFVDTTLLGVGENTGITPLSAAISRLYIMNPDLVSKYRIELITQIEQDFATMLGIEVPHTLITSHASYTHKSGIHINAVLKHGSQTYELIKPQVIGQQRKFIVGSPISGKTTAAEIKEKYPSAQIIEWQPKKTKKKSSNKQHVAINTKDLVLNNQHNHDHRSKSL